MDRRESASLDKYITGNYGEDQFKESATFRKLCFACDRKLGKNPHYADTHEDQCVVVGSECYKAIQEAGESGWQPPKGGPRLWVLTPEREQYFAERGMF